MDFNTAYALAIAEITPQPWDYTDPDGTTLRVIPAGLPSSPGYAEVMIRITTRGATGVYEGLSTTYLTRGAAEIGVTTTDMPRLIASLTEQTVLEHGEWGDVLTLAPETDRVRVEITDTHCHDGERVTLTETMHLPEKQRMPLVSALRRAADVASGCEEE